MTPHFEAHVAQAHAASLQSAASRIGLGIPQLLQLLIQFGPQLVPILLSVLQAFQGGFDWTKLAGLLQTNGPAVIAIVEAVAKALGVTLPTIPGIPPVVTTP